MKGLITGGLLFVVALASIASAQMGDSPMKTDATYLQIKKMIGGTWHTKAGKMDVISHWNSGPDGTSLVAETIVDPHGKAPAHLNARFGWDAATSQIYYLDAHGLDTVYFGHVSMDDKDLVMKFKGIVGDPNEYVFRLKFTSDDAFHATLYNRKDGKDEVVENFDWSRTRD